MFVMLLSTAPCFLNVRNALNVCVSQTYVARHTYSHTTRELGRVVMVMEVHFICSGPVLRRGVGRNDVCVHMAGWGWGAWLVSTWGRGMAGAEAGRSI